VAKNSNRLANSLDMIKLLDTFILLTNSNEKLKPLILSGGGGWKDWFSWGFLPFSDLWQTFLNILKSFPDIRKRRQDVW
jgi:hypothetical protein